MTHARDFGREARKRNDGGSVELWLQLWPRLKGDAEGPVDSVAAVASGLRNGGYMRRSRESADAGMDEAAVAEAAFRRNAKAMRPGDVVVVDCGRGDATFVMTRMRDGTRAVRIDAERRDRTR